MSELQMTIQKAYLLPEKDQNLLAKLIEVFLSEKESTKTKKTKRIVGKYDGKFDVIDDIDFCNDEIAEMFGVTEDK
ncbi:MAG: hypothetical protein IKI75_03155 [Lachnospiraceae bacterium]|nr:hypothetical protein [Lachnospiraceae bacterium]